MFRQSLIALSMAGALCGCSQFRNSGGYARSETGTGAQFSPATSSEDAAFAREACQSGAAELEIGQLAERNTKTREIRHFAKSIATESARAEKELGKIFDRKGIPPEAELQADRLNSIERLAPLKGRAFDEAFKKQIMENQERNIALFESQAERGADRELQAFARKRLESVRRNLARARELPIGHDMEGPSSSESPQPVTQNPAVRMNGFPR